MFNPSDRSEFSLVTYPFNPPFALGETYALLIGGVKRKRFLLRLVLPSIGLSGENALSF